MKDSPPIPETPTPPEAASSARDDRPADTAAPFLITGIERYRPGVVLVAVVILCVCSISSIVRWADDRLFPDPAQSWAVCRAPDGAVEILSRGTTVGEALEQWGVDTAGIGRAALRRTVPDGSRVTVADTRAGRRIIIGELPAAERRALGLVFDINAASAPDIALIPGIGEASAARVVAWRKAHGDFLSKEDLYRVAGLGTYKANTIARYVSFGPSAGDERESAALSEETGASRSTEKMAANDPPVDINAATPAPRVRIPGVGEVTAGRIVENRENEGPFRTVADLERVYGIGKKKAETIGKYVTF